MIIPAIWNKPSLFPSHFFVASQTKSKEFYSFFTCKQSRFFGWKFCQWEGVEGVLGGI